MAIISNDVVEIKEKFGYEVSEVYRQHKVISGAFDQIQVFAQTLGGYFGKIENFKYDKIEMARAYDQMQTFVHSLGGYSHRERWSRTR